MPNQRTASADAMLAITNASSPTSDAAGDGRHGVSPGRDPPVAASGRYVDDDAGGREARLRRGLLKLELALADERDAGRFGPALADAIASPMALLAAHLGLGLDLCESSFAILKRWRRPFAFTALREERYALELAFALALVGVIGGQGLLNSFGRLLVGVASRRHLVVDVEVELLASRVDGRCPIRKLLAVIVVVIR